MKFMTLDYGWLLTDAGGSAFKPPFARISTRSLYSDALRRRCVIFLSDR